MNVEFKVGDKLRYTGVETSVHTPGSVYEVAGRGGFCSVLVTTDIKILSIVHVSELFEHFKHIELQVDSETETDASAVIRVTESEKREIGNALDVFAKRFAIDKALDAQDKVSFQKIIEVYNEY